MIGGTVTQTVVDHRLNRVWVEVVDDNESRNTKCAIFVEATGDAQRIRPGDSVWWQSVHAMWTPYANRGRNRPPGSPEQRGGVDYDIRIPRIGFSGVSKPVLA